MSTRLQGHEDEITDFQWSPMKAETGVSMLGTTSKDGKLILSFLVLEKDEEGKAKAIKVLATQTFEAPDFEPGSNSYYSHLKIAGNPYNGHIAAGKKGSGAVRVLNYKLAPKFAEFDGGLPPEPADWNELQDDDEVRIFYGHHKKTTFSVPTHQYLCDANPYLVDLQYLASCVVTLTVCLLWFSNRLIA